MQSRSRNHYAKRSRWAHVNTPDGLRRRRALIDARRESIAATMPPVDPGPQPGDLWHEITLRVYVPHGPARCDQHAMMIDGQRIGLLSATEIGRKVAAMIPKRQSQAIQADIRREAWLGAFATND